MKKIIQLSAICFTFVMLGRCEANAQESCTEKLYRANNLYEKGQIKEAIELANACAGESNSTTEKWQAYRLLAMAYLVNSQSGEARKAAEKMLEQNPTYKPSALKDPADLFRLLKSIKVIPKFSMGVAMTVGGNFTYPWVTDTYNGADYTKSYTSKGSWQAGALAGYNINPVISIHSGLMASSKSYSVGYIASNWNINIDERATYLDVPLFARFAAFPDRKLRLFVDAGGYVGYLINAQSNFSITNATTGESSSTNNLDAGQRRNNYEYGILYGVGAMYKLGSINIEADLKYYYSYANITNTNNRYQNPGLFYNYYFIEDNIRLNNLAISLSIIYNLNYKVIREK